MFGVLERIVWELRSGDALKALVSRVDSAAIPHTAVHDYLHADMHARTHTCMHTHMHA